MKGHLLTSFRGRGYRWGRNSYTSDSSDPTGIGLSVFRIRPGGKIEVNTAGREAALIALSGRGFFEAGGCKVKFSRRDWEKDGPSAVHVSAGTKLAVRAVRASEIILCSVLNKGSFESRIYPRGRIKPERRGKGILDNAAERIVCTVSDFKNGPRGSKMVFGETINLPGKWSSYPPHVHPQPEIYLYRFKSRDAFGHAELGEAVFKVRDRDLARITGEKVHCQTAAPGFSMYYFWVIRHLPGRPYKSFRTLPQYKWALKPGAKPPR